MSKVFEPINRAGIPTLAKVEVADEIIRLVETILRLAEFGPDFGHQAAVRITRDKRLEFRDRFARFGLVGYFYFRQRWYPGAIDRFKTLLKEDSRYSGRDAVYFYLAEALVKMKQEAEAFPVF